jgi:hypothetical protein
MCATCLRAISLWNWNRSTLSKRLRASAQHGPGLVGFLCQQRGQPIASPALLGQITGKAVCCCDQNGAPARREEGAYLNPYVTDEQRGSRPIFIATYLLFRGQDTSCKPEGLCFTHGERRLTPLIFYIVYVYDRATLDRATL